MMLMPYFSDPAHFPFLVALAIVFILAAIEGVGMLIGAGIFGFLDSLLPDIDLDVDFDVDLDAPDLSVPSLTGQVLSWLQIGRVPVVISLIVFLVSFGLIGLTLQEMLRSIVGTSLPTPIAVLATFVLSLPVLSLGNRVLAAVIPKDETSAVSRDSLIGKFATITLGEARHDFPAQAKVRDQHGQTHYVMLAPDIDGECYAQGDQLLLVRRTKNIYFGIQSDSEAFK